MRRALAVAALLVLGGCATDGYYSGYTAYDTYTYDSYPYYSQPYYDTGPWYNDGPAHYYYGAPAIGGGVHYYNDRRDDYRWHPRDRDRDRDGGRRHDRDAAGRAPAEHWDAGNTTRPRDWPRDDPRLVPGTRMTPEEHQTAAGR